MKKQNYLSHLLIISLMVILSLTMLTACSFDNNSTKDVKKTIEIGNTLSEKQPTPTDIDYSLERYNLIRRAYWVNGQREKAASVVCNIQRPLGYIILFTPNGAVVGKFVVDGKISSLNSFLTPDSEFYENNNSTSNNNWIPDVDGSYGSNDSGIFFFTPDGKYIEWNGTYLYSDIPFEINDPVIKLDN